jgi:two-component system, LytTR family, sensor kinase
MNSSVIAAADRSKFEWIFKYKLHHLPFWFGYHFMWWTLRIGSPVAVISNLAIPHAAAKFIFYMAFQMVGVYFNLYILIPRILEKGQYVKYVILLVLTIIVTAALIASSYYLVALFSEKTFQELYHMDPANYYSLFESGTLPSTAASMTLAMSIKLTKNWLQSRKKHQELEKEKLETELKFLKSQMNPHFLFNTINSIFVLITKNPAMASEALAKFSDLLRYQLYECNELQIPLHQELSYVENYVKLQELRQDSNLVELAMHVDPPSAGNRTIAPFVLIPFIENAFKHVSRQKDLKNWIKIKIGFEQQFFSFLISNSISSAQNSSNEVFQQGGIGLKNVKRRLDLTYPGEHQLEVDKGTDHFEVRLQLKLHENLVIERAGIAI